MRTIITHISQCRGGVMSHQNKSERTSEALNHGGDGIAEGGGRDAGGPAR